jgi:hypothetical protein
MSIQGEIDARVSEGRLCLLKQVFITAPDRRLIYLVNDVLKKLNGPWPNIRDGRRAGVARALLENFARGDEVVGRMPPSKNVNTVIALLEPPADNVWEFRVGDPQPGVRILGRFAAPDIFIATNWSNREDFRDPVTKKDDLRKWRNEIVRSKAIWTQLFPSYDPFIGSTIHDFISNSRLPV